MNEAISYNPEHVGAAELTAILLPMNVEHQSVENFARKRTEALSGVSEILGYLNQIPRDRLNPYFIKVLEMINEIFQKFEPRLDRAINAEDTRGKVIDELKDKLTKLTGSEEMPGKEIFSLLLDRFSTATDISVCLSETHSSTYFSLSAAVEARESEDLPNLAVIVFDNHPDVFHGDAYDEKVVTDANVFLALADSGIINGSVFIGPQDSGYTIPHANEIMNETLKKHYPEAGEETFFISINQDTLSKQQESTGEDKRVSLEQQISKALQILSKDSINTIVFSIDIDFLNSSRIGYSGFQYSPYELLRQITQAEIPEKKPTDLSSVEVEQLFLSMFTNLDELRDNFKREVPEEKIKQLMDDMIHMNPLAENLETQGLDPKTLTLGDVGRAIDQIVKECKLYGIEVGIRLKGGGKYIGDVVGFEGQDYKGQTAKATKALVDRLAKATK